MISEITECDPDILLKHFDPIIIQRIQVVINYTLDHVWSGFSERLKTYLIKNNYFQGFFILTGGI